MNDEVNFLKFPIINQQNVSEQPKFPKFGNRRVKLEAPCPGNKDNLVTVTSGFFAKDGLGRPKNIGTCDLHLAYYDRSGKYLGHHTLKPNEEATNLKTPPETNLIKFGCQQSCSGTAILEHNGIDVC